MAYYIKARKCVADYLKKSNVERLTLKDGNMLLWQQDIRTFGPLCEIDSICQEIGAVKLTDSQASAEVHGLTCVELPEPTDPRFATAKPTETEEPADEPTETEEPTEEPETEEPSEAAEPETEPDVEPINTEDDEHSEQSEND